MEPDRHIRALAAEQLGIGIEDLRALPLIDLALGLADRLGIEAPRYRLGCLRTYGDLLRLLRDALAAATCEATEGSGCYLRARLRSRGVTIVRLGALTPEFAAALADDLRHAPEGTLLDLVAPDDLTDAELDALGARLAWLTGGRARIAVRRAGDAFSGNLEVGPHDSARCDRSSQGLPESLVIDSSPQRFEPGIAVAPVLRHRCNNIRRTSP